MWNLFDDQTDFRIRQRTTFIGGGVERSISILPSVAIFTSIFSPGASKMPGATNLGVIDLFSGLTHLTSRNPTVSSPPADAR